jgi:uncharacterized protein HemX
MEQEDSSTYKNQPDVENRAVETPTPPADPAPQVVERKKKSRLTPVLLTLLLLALIAAGVMGWLWQQEASKAVSSKSDVAVAKQKVLDLQDQLKKVQAKASDASTTTDTKDSDSETMIKTALAFAKAKVANTGYPEGATDLVAKIDNQSANFTRVQIGSSTKGPGVDLVYFKKVNNEWQLIGDDNGNMERFHTSFGIPSGF